MASRSEELANIVRTRRSVGTISVGGIFKSDYDQPIYNTPERLEAADELAKAGAIETLPALQDFFVECVKTLNPSDLCRLGRALLVLGGGESFDGMMVARILPALETAVLERCSYSSESELRKELTTMLSFLRMEFGSIGNWVKSICDWEEEVAKRITKKLAEVAKEDRERSLRLAEWGKELGDKARKEVQLEQRKERERREK